MQIVALVDCNNFFVSCERLFQPSLKGLPVAVLSNNDGCIISRSDEAKKLGLSFDPYFKVKDFCKANRVRIFSSNFPLYGDISRRIMSILQEVSPEVEVYSIDEAFISLSHIPSIRLCDYANDIRSRILKEIGIPVTIGISSTKALAKIAQDFARKNSMNNYVLLEKEKQDKILSITKVSDIWGIGRNLSRTLDDLGVQSALAFRDMDSCIVRKYLKLSGQKLQHELKGIKCFEIEQIHSAKQNIAVSRSFACSINSPEDLSAIISEFVFRASVKLRRQDSLCSSIHVYIRTGYSNYTNRYSASNMEHLGVATSDTSKLIEAAKKAFARIFKSGFDYKKAGIILSDLSSNKYRQLSLTDSNNEESRDALFSIVDKINAKSGSNAIFLLAQSSNQKWVGKREFCSPKYTTSWNELLTVR